MLSRKCVLLTIFLSLAALLCSQLLPCSMAICTIGLDEPEPRGIVLVLLTAEEIPRYFQYKDSDLTPVVRVRISYREVDKNKDNTEVQYEDLWYANGQVVGLVRHHHFDPKQSQIILRVHQEELAESEMEATANALVRLYLDANLNDNIVYTCVVPDDSFDEMIDAFGMQQFYAPGTSDTPRMLDPTINMPLHTATSGQNRILQFAIQ